MKKMITCVLVFLLVAAFLPLLVTTDKAIAGTNDNWNPWGLGRTNLGVQNARFGSRFDLNYHQDPNHNKCWTSTMGAQMDSQTSAMVATRLNADGGAQRFDPSDNWMPRYQNQGVQVQPDRMTLCGQHTYSGTSNAPLGVWVSMISPLIPTTSLSDPNLKMAVMPAFYENVSLYNSTDVAQSGQILVSFDYAVGYKQVGDTKIVYYQTPSDNGGLRALAVTDSSASWGIGTRIFNDFVDRGHLINSSQVDDQYHAGGFVIPFSIGPHQGWGKTLVYGSYKSGTVMNDRRNGHGQNFYYTTLFGSIEKVIQYAFANYQDIVYKSAAFSNSLGTGNPAQNFVTSTAVHSWIANTWLLHDPRTGGASFYVTEGDCQYLSTVDLGYDTAYFETLYAPWALKLQLQEWSQYGFYDKYGILLYHDMGIGTEIRASQAYSYSLMGVEENVNYVLMLYLYWKKTGDTGFLKTKIPLVQQIMTSLKNRDGNGDGIADRSCYNTTFDFDMGGSAAGIADNNVYIAIKEFASFLTADKMFQATGTSGAATCRQWADKICSRLKGVFHDCGYLPTSLNLNLPGAADHTILNYDGLLYLFLTDMQSPIVEDLVCNTASTHLNALSNCNAPYGYRLSSSCLYTWISKSLNAKVINDYLCIRGHYSIENDEVIKANSLLGQNALGFTDSWNAGNGVASCLNLYPRGVSSVIPSTLPPKFVTMIYQRWLKRDPDPGGYQGYLSAISSGSLSPNQVTDIVRHSDEYANRFVDETFREIFGHPQDQAGHQCYVNALVHRQITEEQIRTEFLHAAGR